MMLCVIIPFFTILTCNFNTLIATILQFRYKYHHGNMLIEDLQKILWQLYLFVCGKSNWKRVFFCAVGRARSQSELNMVKRQDLARILTFIHRSWRLLCKLVCYLNFFQLIFFINKPSLFSPFFFHQIGPLIYYNNPSLLLCQFGVDSGIKFLQHLKKLTRTLA